MIISTGGIFTIKKGQERVCEQLEDQKEVGKQLEGQRGVHENLGSQISNGTCVGRDLINRYKTESF